MPEEKRASFVKQEQMNCRKIPLHFNVIKTRKNQVEMKHKVITVVTGIMFNVMSGIIRLTFDQTK